MKYININRLVWADWDLTRMNSSTITKKKISKILKHHSQIKCILPG